MCIYCCFSILGGGANLIASLLNPPLPLPMKTKDNHQTCHITFREFGKSPWGGGQKSLPHKQNCQRAVMF